MCNTYPKCQSVKKKGVSVCNTYPKWHLALCDDGGMSVEECGRECVHVTPLDVSGKITILSFQKSIQTLYTDVLVHATPLEVTALRSEPNQQKDLEAASIASHHQVSSVKQMARLKKKCFFFCFCNFFIQEDPETVSIAFTPPGKNSEKNSMSYYICAINSLCTDFSEFLPAPAGLSKVSIQCLYRVAY